MTTIQITEAAAHQIMDVAKKRNNPSLFLRLIVESGGCSGFKYIFQFEDTLKEDDLTFQKDDAVIAIDNVSFTLLDGSIIDYHEDLSTQQFVIKNPNAGVKCGCGNSFGI
ncbi:MAG: iron-sulfur cluster insertion protein ErpA [Proteobacteria bacterium]|nr:iron-sulfur cluster insertion protein ErpA [Pseudomonadota bacterium]